MSTRLITVVSVVALLLAAVSVAYTATAMQSISSEIQGLKESSAKAKTLSDQLTATNKNVELLAQATGVPLGKPEEVRKIVEQRQLVEAAKKEGRLVIYGPFVQLFDQNPEALKYLKQDFPFIEFDLLYMATGAVFERTVAEQSAGKYFADILTWSETQMPEVKKRGLVQPYLSPEMNFLVPGFSDAEGYFLPIYTVPRTWVYNTNLITPQDVPTTYESINDPKFKGKVGLPDPTTQEATLISFWAIKKHLGDKWTPWIQGLARQEPRFYADLTPAVTAVSRGEVAVTIAQPKQAAREKFQKGFPVWFAALREPLYTTAIGISIGKNAPHPNAAKLFIDWMLSEKVQREVWAGMNYEFPMRAGVKTVIREYGDIVIKPVPSFPSEDREALIKELRTVFRR